MNGKNCFIRCGNDCKSTPFEGIWDASEDGCGQCNGKIQIKSGNKATNTLKA